MNIYIYMCALYCLVIRFKNLRHEMGAMVNKERDIRQRDHIKDHSFFFYYFLFVLLIKENVLVEN